MPTKRVSSSNKDDQLTDICKEYTSSIFTFSGEFSAILQLQLELLASLDITTANVLNTLEPYIETKKKHHRFYKACNLRATRIYVSPFSSDDEFIREIASIINL